MQMFLCCSGVYLGCQNDAFNLLQSGTELKRLMVVCVCMAHAGTGTWIHGWVDGWMDGCRDGGMER